MDNLNKGHGHVTKRPDGVKARCGGPGFCKVCQDEKAALERAASPAESVQSVDTDEFWNYVIAYVKGSGTEGVDLVKYIDGLLVKDHNRGYVVGHAEGRRSAMEELAKEKERADRAEAKHSQQSPVADVWVDPHTKQRSILAHGTLLAPSDKREFVGSLVWSNDPQDAPVNPENLKLRTAHPLQQEGGKDLISVLREYLLREMPSGTVIGDPTWWAPRIAKAIAAPQPSDNLQQASTAQAEPAKRKEPPFVPAGYENETEFLRQQLKDARTSIKAHQTVLRELKEAKCVPHELGYPTPETDAGNAYTNGWNDCRLTMLGELVDDPTNHPVTPAQATPEGAELPPLPETLGLVDIDYAQETPADWDAEYRNMWQSLQVAKANMKQWRKYALSLRAALAATTAAEPDWRMIAEGHALNAAALQEELDALKVVEPVRADLIELAKQAGLWVQRHGVWMAIGGEAELLRFVELYRAAPPQQVGMHHKSNDINITSDLTNIELDATRWQAFRNRDDFDDLYYDDFKDKFREEADSIIDNAIKGKQS